MRRTKSPTLQAGNVDNRPKESGVERIRRLRTVGSAELRAILETLTDGIQVFDVAGTMISRNRAAAIIYGVDEEEPTKAAILEKWETLREDGSPMPGDEGPLAIAMASGEASEGRIVGIRRRRDGLVRWLSVSTSPIRGSAGDVTGYVSCNRDLTERVETSRSLRILTAAARQLSSSLVRSEVAAALTATASELCSAPGERPRRAVFMLVDDDSLILSGLTDSTHASGYNDPVVPLADNPYARKVLATGETLVTGFRADDFGPSSSDVIRQAGVRNAAMLPMSREGDVFAILAVSGRQEAIMSDEVIAHLHTLATMGALAYTNAELHEQATLESRTDALTGLGNRRALQERSIQLPRAPFAVIAIDVDGLKAVNDAQGHSAGDRLLASVAAAMNAATRPSDILVRVGGDEFVALLVSCDLAGAHEAGDRLRSAVAAVALPWGKPSISLGCAAGKAGDDPSEVALRADAELYRGKAKR